MRPSGLAEVEAAKADGRWAAAYASQRNATVPPDLAAALAASPHTQAFDALTRTQQYAVILKLVTTPTATDRRAVRVGRRARGRGGASHGVVGAASRLALLGLEFR
jgi:uncharacterized protein YdeI (YjbR/CyaY-like superfamily)